MAFVFHGRLGGYLLLTICLSTCLSVFGRTLTKHRKNLSVPEVTIPQGTVRGTNMETVHGRPVNAFMGIPYAQPPVGDLRFKAPLPPTPWNGTYDASNHVTMCVQMDGDEVVGDEDCLHLNVFTPKLPSHRSSTPLPVILYIFGGGFESGSSAIAEYNPDFLLDEDVILVVPNHRVNVLGWLSTGDEVSPGNNGLKDIVRALEWNRDNIKYFGGDPERVTVVGSSSGSVIVSLLVMSDSTEGLFQQFIQDGESALHLPFQESNEVAVQRAYTLGAYLGCPTNTSRLMVDCLCGLNASQLVDTTSLFHVSELVNHMPWHPTAEPDIEGAFLTKTPNEIMASGKIRDIPSIRINVRDEGLYSTSAFHADEGKLPKLMDNFDHLLPHLLGYSDAIKNVEAFTAALKSYYFNDLNASSEVLLANLTKLISDVQFGYPSYKELNHYLAHAKSPQYYLVLEHRDALSFSYAYSGYSLTKDVGVAHCDVLIYVFLDHAHMAGPVGYEYSKADMEMVKIMVELWTSFAINGTPNAKDDNGTNIWEPYSANRNYLRVGNGKEVGIDVKYGWNQPRMDFMAELEAMIEWK